MKKIFIPLILVFLLSLSAAASHITAAELTYRSNGGNDYIITLTFYRDCSGIAEPTNVTINFKSSCSNFSVVLNKIPPTTGEIVTPLCPTATSYCNGGTLFACRKFVYEGIVTLPACSDWKISYTLCCRNPSNTISSPTNADLFIMAELNNAAAPENSSPYFNSDPTGIIYTSQNNILDFSAIDDDGDSLVYSLATPYDDGPGTSTPYVTYLAGYSATQAFGPLSPLTWNGATGIWGMVPDANLTTLFVVLVEEYRNIGGVPVKIASVMRDIQMTSITSSNTAPVLAGLNSNAVAYDASDTLFLIDACANQTSIFNIFAHDADAPADSLTLTLVSGLPGAIWTVSGNGSSHPVGHFTWNPDSTMLNSSPHFFIVEVSDDNCPYLAKNRFKYYINVIENSVFLILPIDSVCDDGGAFALSGGNPAGGTYFGTGVSGGMFDPALASLGNNTIYYVYPNALCKDTISDVIWVSECSVIDEFNVLQNVRIYPLPFLNTLSIGSQIPMTGLRLSILDVTGRSVYQTTITDDPTYLYTLETAFLKKGVYILMLEDQTNSSFFKIVKGE